MKRISFLLFLSFTLLISCKQKTADIKRQPLLQVEGKFLYLDEIQQVLPPNINKKDSAEIAQSYIRKWVTDVLMFENAKRNITNQSEIDELVESYRKSLTIHQYQQRLIQQRLPEQPTDDELKAFYAQYSDQLILKENIIKGLLLVVPQTARNMSSVRSWVQSGNTKALESIEKYSIQNAISYDYFGDKWMSFTEILKKIPLKVQDPAAFVTSTKFVETSDSLQHYFLRIIAYHTTGQVEPYEMAKNRISIILQNKLKADFISQFEKDLYDDATSNGTVKFYKKK
jgi:hypothetical protein